MGSFSNYLEIVVLDAIFGNTAGMSEPSKYIALCTAVPTDASTGGTIAEVSGTNYARIQTTASDWDAAASGAITNGAAITFATAGAGGWDEAVAFAIIDNSGGGNMLMFGTLAVAKTATEGDVVEFAIGDLDITLD